MGYSTVEQVRLLLVGVNNSPATDYDLTPTQLSDPQIEAEIANADSEIDSRLGARYQVPFTGTVPALIQSLSIDIAAYLSDLRYRGAREYSNELHPFYLRYQRALGIIADIANGLTDLPGGELPPDDDGSGGNSIAINMYDGTLFTTNHIFTRFPEGTISDG